MTTARASPVAVLVMVTVAPGSAACCASLTTPSSENVGVCAAASAGTLSTITRAGTNVPFTVQTIKGVPYAFFTAATATYQARYS